MFDFNNNYQKIQELIRNYRAIKRRATELFDEREIYNHQKAELFARFGNRYGNVADSEARIYTEQELTQLRLELANSAGLWPLIKSMLGFGKSQREVYRELMGKLTGLLNFMEDQIRDCRSEADAIWYSFSRYPRNIHRHIKVPCVMEDVPVILTGPVMLYQKLSRIQEFFWEIS